MNERLLAAIKFYHCEQDLSRSLNRDECAYPCQTSGRMHDRLQGKVRSTSDAVDGLGRYQKDSSGLIFLLP
jgi:hypothetical protein